MAAAAPKGESHEVLLSTPEKENFQRIARLLVAGGTAIMRELFDQFCNPSQLVVKLKNPSIKKNIMKAKLTKPQLDYLFPKTGTRNKSSKDFDISLIFKLFRTICNLTPPARGWDNFPPPPTDYSLAADLLRIKGYRNKICHDYSDMEMSDTEFKSLWNDIQEALVRLAGKISLSAQSAWEKEIEKLLTDPLTPEEVNNAKELMEMCENEVECKEEIKKVGKSLQEGFDGVHQAIKRTGDDVHQAIKRTGDDVHQAIKRSGDDVHQAIEKFIKNFEEKKIAEKKNDSETSPLLTESVLVGGAQDSDFLGEERASAPWDASAVPADQLPHLSSVGKLTPPGKMFTETLSQRSRQLPAGDNVEDFKKLCEIAAAVEMETESLKTAKELKEKLGEFIIERRQEARKTFQVISEAGKADEHKRSELRRLYREASKIIHKLDDEFINPLETSLGDIKRELEENIRNLAPRDQYVVLVAGETSAGKSSVINLLLGEEILPNAVLSTTSTIFELKHDETPKIVMHLIDPPEPLCCNLVGPKESFLDQITNLINKENNSGRVSPFRKIELFWPHPLFQERVVIVDSPGVGDNDTMNEAVLNYLPNAFCFIYVISSINAGGVQEDRLGMLLSNAASLKREAKMDLKLFASCALFVCNKWDLIEPGEVEGVKSEQIKSLTKRLRGLDPDLQIVHLSCKYAQMAQKYGVVRSDFHDLIDGISSLLVSSMQSNLDIYTRWLDDLLSRVSRQITLLLRSTAMSRREKDEKMKGIKKRMEELERSQNETIEELGKEQSQLIREITGKLAFHFKATETSTRFCEWSPTEVPTPKTTWEDTEDEILQSISNRSHYFVQEWEDKEQEFAKVQEKIIRDLCKKYNIMEEEIRKVEDEVLLVDRTAEVFQQEKRTNTLQKIQKRFRNVPIATKNPVWLRQGLASVVIRSPLSKLVSKFKEKLEFPKKLRKYKSDPCAYMSVRCKASLEILSDQDRLLPFMREQLKDSVQLFNQMKEKIPKLIKGDKQLYQHLLSDTRNKVDILKFYEPISEVLESLRGDMAIYAFKEIRRSDFLTRDLKWEEDCKSIIGRGSLSTVYAGVLARKEEKEVKVALKVYTVFLSKENEWRFWDEDMTLRQVRGHPSIVEFYGTHLLRGPEGAKVVIVSEQCKDSIEKLIFSKSDHTPLPTRKKVLRWAVQIVDALNFIHGKELSHQHLKLENVMLTQEENVKLKGIGRGSFRMIKEIKEDDLRYLAPEVLESEGRNYDSKSDMFSFSILLWELWYCEMAFQTSSISHTQHLHRLKEGARPTYIEGKDLPWPIWRDVMKACWSGELSNRLTAQESWNKLCSLESVLSKPLPELPTSPSTPPPRPSQRSKQRKSSP